MTLIELLVVSMIIGILGVIIFINLRRALWKAREGQTFEALQTLRTVVQVFYAQKGPEYSYTQPGGNSTNGYPYALAYSSWSAWGFPNDYSWSGGGTATDGINNMNEPDATVEAGEFQAYINTYIKEIPYARVSRDGLMGGQWQLPDDQFAGWFNNGLQQTNLPVTAITSNPGNNADTNYNYRGFHYRNTDGKVRINNTCLSTEGRRYDYY